MCKKRDRGDEMTVIGYARVSTIDQDLSIQKSTLRAAGCNVIRAEKRSGATTASRKKLRTVLEFLHSGDVLMVTRIDSLARSIGDLQDIVRAIKAKGASLKVTEQPIDTSTAAGKAFLDMLGVFAEFETNLGKERQREGIAEGRYKGRPTSIDVSKVHELKAQGKGVTDIAREMKIARASVYRALKGRREMSLLRLGSRGGRQAPEVYGRRGPLAGRGDGAEGQAQEGEPLKDRSERTLKPVGGETGAYLLSRLRRERPDLAEKETAGRIPARAAALEAGFVKSAKIFRI
jgi:DNA invertase Pin-like site-specific DNA recombinase